MKTKPKSIWFVCSKCKQLVELKGQDPLYYTKKENMQALVCIKCNNHK